MSRWREAGLLPWIAAERGLRALVLIAAGVVLIANAHRHWGQTIVSVARHLGLDPSDNGIRRIAARANALSAKQLTVYGVIAIGYGALEGVEATDSRGSCVTRGAASAISRPGRRGPPAARPSPASARAGEVSAWAPTFIRSL